MTESGLALLLRTLEEVERTGEKRWPQWEAMCPCHEDVTPSLSISYRVPSKHDPDLDDPKPMVNCRLESCRANLEDVCLVPGFPSIGRVMLYNDQWNDEIMGEPPPPAHLPPPAMLVTWRKRLLVMPERLAYLQDKRGINKDTIKRHCIGWDFHRYTVPIRGEDGSVVNLRRYLPGGEPKWVGLAGRSVKYLYPYPYFPGRWVLLVEGELDALIARQHGLPAVTCIGGVGTWDPNWNPAFAGRLVAICFDCDEAGRSAAIARSRELRAAGARVRTVDLGLGDKEDLTDFFVKYGRTTDDLIEVLRRSPFTGYERPRVRRLAATTAGKKKVPATERQPGLSSSPNDKEKMQR